MCECVCCEIKKAFETPLLCVSRTGDGPVTARWAQRSGRIIRLLLFHNKSPPQFSGFFLLSLDHSIIFSVCECVDM